jgi:hypothetical protein
VIRNADHVTLRSLRIRTTAGPAVRAENARDLRLFDVGMPEPHAGTAAVEFTNVAHAFIQGSYAPEGSDVFLSVRGRETRAIILGVNDLWGARAPVMLGGDVSPSVITRR